MFSKTSFLIRGINVGSKRNLQLRNLLLLATIAVGALAILYFSRPASAANITWNGGGGDNNWSTGANWLGGTPPGSGDVAVFNGAAPNGNKNVNIDININVQGIQINGYTNTGPGTGTITQATGSSVTLGSSGYSQSTGTFTGGNSDITINAPFNLTGGAFNAPSGTLSLSSDFTIGAGGTFNPNGGTVAFAGSLDTTLTVPASLTLNNITVNKTTGVSVFFNSTSTLVATGTLTLTDGVINGGSGTIDAQGPVSIASTFDGSSAGSVIVLISGAATRTVTLPVGAGLPILTVNAPNVTLNASGAPGTITFSRGLNVQSAASFTNGAVNFIFSNAFAFGAAVNFTPGSGDLTFNSSFTQSGGTFNAGSGALNFNSTFTLNGGTFNAPSGTLTFAGSNVTIAAAATFNPNGGTVAFAGSLDTTLMVPASLTLNNITVNKMSSISVAFDSTSTLVATGTLTLTDGVINNNAGTGTIDAQGPVSIASTFDGGSAKLSFSGSANQTFTNNGGANPTGTWTVNKSSGKVTLASNLILTNSQPLNITSGTLDQGASFNLRTSNTLTIGASGTLRDFGSGDLTLGGNLINNGTFNFNGGGTNCGDPNVSDQILIRSSSAGTTRAWSGGGAFSVVDVDVQDQDASAIVGGITAFGSSVISNSPGWSLNSGCPIAVTTQPNNVSACPGSPASFTVAVSGTGPTFLWRKNGTPLSDGGNISGATSATLTINPVGAGDVASSPGYDAIGTNSFGVTATSNPATLSLLMAPTVSSNPGDTTVCEKATASFTAAGNGDPTPTVQWQASTDGGATFNNIGGATSTTLSFTANATQNGNKFRAVFTNTCNSAITSPATLTVNTAPAVSTQPTDQEACAGTSASFSVAATGTGLNFQWRKNGTPLSNGGNISGATTATLTVNPVGAGDGAAAGVGYDVVVSGTCSPTVTSTRRALTVNTAPTISTNPGDTTVCENATATFTASANGSPSPTVQWQVSTDGGATFNNIGGATSTTLSFTTSASQSGNKFRAVFTNTCNSATTTPATLTVNTAPAVSANPGDTAVCEGAMASFTAAANGSPTLTTQWQVSTDGGANFNDIPGATSTTLSFTTSATQSGNKFRAVFANSCNTATTNAATLTVNGFALSAPSQTFPSAGGNGSVDVITGNTCSWTAASNDSFVHVTTGGGGTGNGTVNFTVDPSSGSRTGTMTIARQTFTVNQSGPTAADGKVSGRIVDNNGRPVEGVAIRMSGTQNRLTITDANGNYHFGSVETNGFYTVTPARANYAFSPSNRSFSQLANQTDAVFTAILDANPTENPLDSTEYFVRQHYLDFLGREPEEAGFTSWVIGINNCAVGDASCDRVHVSEMFFRSQEFQERGYFVYRFYSSAFGRKPDYGEFKPDIARVSGFLTKDQLEAAKVAFVSDFMARPAFAAQYNSLSNSAYVDALINTAQVNLSNRQALIDGLNAGTLTRAQVLRQVAESGDVYQKYYNQAFVVMEYFGYLRRDPDALYLNWIQVLDQTGDPRHMVEGFVNSLEYRGRFGP